MQVQLAMLFLCVTVLHSATQFAYGMFEFICSCCQFICDRCQFIAPICTCVLCKAIHAVQYLNMHFCRGVDCCCAGLKPLCQFSVRAVCTLKLVDKLAIVFLWCFCAVLSLTIYGCYKATVIVCFAVHMIAKVLNLFRTSISCILPSFYFKRPKRQRFHYYPWKFNGGCGRTCRALLTILLIVVLLLQSAGLLALCSSVPFTTFDSLSADVLTLSSFAANSAHACVSGCGTTVCFSITSFAVFAASLLFVFMCVRFAVNSERVKSALGSVNSERVKSALGSVISKRVKSALCMCCQFVIHLVVMTLFYLAFFFAALLSADLVELVFNLLQLGKSLSFTIVFGVHELGCLCRFSLFLFVTLRVHGLGCLCQSLLFLFVTLRVHGLGCLCQSLLFLFVTFMNSVREVIICFYCFHEGNPGFLSGTCFAVVVYFLAKAYWYVRSKYMPVQFVFMQAGINDYHLQQATGRIPPGYDPSHERRYPFRTWLIDLALWRVATDADPIRHGPMVAIRLGGAARDLMRELDANTLANGRLVPDPAGGQPFQQSGLDYLIQLLTNNFAPLAQEVQLSAIHELFTFRKGNGDSYDECITKFELMIHRVENHGNIQIPVLLRSYMLLNSLHVPRDKWVILLAPTVGMLPQDDPQYRAFLTYLRASGHLIDGTQQVNISNHNQGQNRHYYNNEPQQQESQQTYWNSPISNQWVGPQVEQPSSSSWIAPSPETYWSAPNEEEEELSSGHSNSESEIGFADVAFMPTDLAGETLYLAYRGAKRRFRSFSKSGPRKGKGKGRFRKGGKGKGKSMGFGGKQLFYSDGSPVEAEDPTSDDVVVFECYYQKGKGKGGKGRKNPIGPDGKVMRCSVPGCGSEEHFRAHCPKGKGKGGGGKPSTSFYAPPTSQPIYLAGAIEEPASRITYSDGSFETIPHTFESEATPQTAGPRFLNFFARLFAYPWWCTEHVFHALVRLAGNSREGLLIDCGAVDNLAGDKWVRRTSDIAKFNGQATVFKPRERSTVEGVGSGSSVVDQTAIVPVCLKNGIQGNFETAVVSQSELPALMGLKTLAKNRSLLDIANKKLIYVGPGGYDLKLSPGSVTMQLEQVESGHLLLPCTEWPKAKQ